MVDRLDNGAIAAALGPLDYKGLYKVISCTLLFGMLDLTMLDLLTYHVFFRRLERHSSGHM